MSDPLGGFGTLDLLSMSRNSFRRSFSRAAASLRQLQSASISRGRLGFPRPLSGGGRIGLSASSRATLNEFFSSTQSMGNALLSQGVSGAGTVEGLLTQIRGIRAGLSATQLAPALRESLNADEGKEKGGFFDGKA